VNVFKTLTQKVYQTFIKRLNNVDTAFTKRYRSCSETVPPLGYTRLNGLLGVQDIEGTVFHDVTLFGETDTDDDSSQVYRYIYVSTYQHYIYEYVKS
jgi:hypothetical protein